MSGTVMMCRQAVGNSTATSRPSMSMASSWDLALKPWSRAKLITSSRVDWRRLADHARIVGQGRALGPRLLAVQQQQVEITPGSGR